MAATGPQAETSAEIQSRAHTLISQHRVAEGLQLLRDNVAANPQDREALATAALLIADWDSDRNEIVSWLQRAHEAVPNDELVFAKLIDTLQADGRQAEADAVAQAHLEKCSADCGNAQLTVAEAARRNGDNAAERAALEAATGDASTRDAAYRTLVSFAERTHDDELAAASLRQLIESSRLQLQRTQSGGERPEYESATQALKEDLARDEAALARIESRQRGE